MLVYKHILYMTRLLFCQGYPRFPLMCSFFRKVSCFRRHDGVSVFHLHEVSKSITIMICKRLAGRRFTFIILVVSCFDFHSIDEHTSRSLVEALLMIERVISLLESGNRGLKWIMFESYKNHVPKKSSNTTDTRRRLGGLSIGAICRRCQRLDIYTAAR